MNMFRCGVCGYIHEGEAPPETCPNCGAPKDRFAEYEGPSEGDSSGIHIHYGAKLDYGAEIATNPFFGDYESLAPFIYNLPIGEAAPLHKHPTTDELFLIIKGKLRFTVGDAELTASPGDIVQGRMDIPHTFANIGDEPAAFLSVKGPKPVDLELLEQDD